MRVWAGIVLAAALAACSQEGQLGSTTAPAADVAEMAGSGGAPPPPPPPVAAEETAQDAAAQESPRAQPSPGAPQGPDAPTPVSYLAYAYTLGLELPSDRLIGVMEGHAAACRQAGPRFCQLIGAERSGDPDAYIRGSVTLRGEPAWLERFMATVATDAANAGGEIKAQSTSTEDLTRAIIDTEATLRAKRALRDRLQRLLESRPGRLADLLEVERELARVQAEIDSTESNLAAMRTRVSMSMLTLSYESAARSIRSDTFEPLGRALAGFLGAVVQGVATIVWLVAVLIPWAVLAAGVVWLALWIRRRRGGRLLPRKQDTPPTAANS
jgi:hypothetical protein